MTSLPQIKFITAADMLEVSRRADFDEVVRVRARPLEELSAEGAERDAPLMLVIDESESVAAGAVDLLAAIVRGVGADRDRFGKLVEAFMPVELVESPAISEQARRNAQARAAFLAEVPTASSAEVAERYGSVARNRAALAQSWRKQGRIFAVPKANAHQFPVFQFTDAGEPKPVVGDVLSRLRAAGLDGWQIALWFTGRLSSLGNSRPIDLIDTEPARVVEAASNVAEIPQ
jgi:hypothetical protein